MSALQMAVPVGLQHTHVETTSRGDNMNKQEEYAATYQFGNTKVNIVAPPPKTKKEIDAILREYHMAGWAIIREMREKETVIED
ncbi:hypothetical protein M3215_06975 [Bacillus cytotoxicus]|uniref:Uncharacterized protein n=1 Tax=Bacillus cytotoxicus TaxID=580165 RepID=A0ACC6A3T7_9BACI|nr:hypothetical protein [Bacillus cytotoxicus]